MYSCFIFEVFEELDESFGPQALLPLPFPLLLPIYELPNIYRQVWLSHDFDDVVKVFKHEVPIVRQCSNFDFFWQEVVLKGVWKQTGLLPYSSKLILSNDHPEKLNYP